MYKALLLVFALFLLSGLQPAEATNPGTRYARAKAKGRVYTHRPSYKVYRGFRKGNRKGLKFFHKKRSHKLRSTVRARRF
ncbi:MULTISPECIES: hypothetical protein [Hymenobacter]|uniref:PBCV-specific basic adaptor domain-containing protein n=2 Tax=Hymenobacter TaxID=89966 RepID=A0ABS6X125_9BACT|nr:MULTISPECIES: hypothetical protein [Hymenobacter]MBO3270845.1 hypothetical protein [Hymenobacter defluvii]MBW3129394.1 hypothetical protein [Hymenobacter profundi]QNE39562.1 hypothetical protein F1C16_08375 [Hymenobacter sp. NBH84]